MLAFKKTELDVQKEKDKTFHILFDTIQGYSCDCEEFHPDDFIPKYCRHIKLFLFMTEIEQKLIELEARGFFTFTSEGTQDNIMNSIKRIGSKYIGTDMYYGKEQ